MARIDESEYLIHFTKGDSIEDAYLTFKKILREGHLICGTGFIKESKCCVCFTEAPMNCLKDDNALDARYFDRYSPFGILFPKKHIAQKKGRHVIYSPESELNQIPEHLLWRYVRYEPNFKPDPIDYTFEREWRLNKPRLALNPRVVKVIFPTKGWMKKYEDDHYDEQHLQYEECKCNRDIKIFQYAQLFDPAHAEMIVEDCPTPQQLPWMMTYMIDSMSLDFDLT